MTAEESAVKKFQDEPYFEILVQSITRKATQYTYAKIKCNKTLGAGNTIDCIIRNETLKKINSLENSEPSL
jgi:hypothetical protein